MAWTALIAPITALIDKVIPDKGEAARLAHEIATLAEKQAHEINLAQIEVNKTEAKGNLFQSTWRPLVGHTCAIAFAWHFVLQPVIVFILTTQGKVITLPAFDMSSLLTVLMGLLGLGGLRSFEKLKGLTK